MPSALVRYGAILLIFVLWVIATSWAVSSVLRIHRVGNVDTAVAVRLVRKALFRNPFAMFSELVRERADLALSLTAQEGITLALAPADGVISSEYLRDRRQYLLAVWNPSKDPFSAINLRLQFPYPVESHQISVQREAEGVSFQAPAATMYTMNVFGGGQIRMLRQPLYADYELQIAQLQPGGRLELLLVLNSWRDPRGRTIPPHEGARYFVPDFGPEITYIYGRFSFTVAGETIERDYYAPLILNDDKTIALGTMGPPPKKLVFRTGME